MAYTDSHDPLSVFAGYAHTSLTPQTQLRPGPCWPEDRAEGANQLTGDELARYLSGLMAHPFTTPLSDWGLREATAQQALCAAILKRADGREAQRLATLAELCAAREVPVSAVTAAVLWLAKFGLLEKGK